LETLAPAAAQPALQFNDQWPAAALMAHPNALSGKTVGLAFDGEQSIDTLDGSAAIGALFMRVRSKNSRLATAIPLERADRLPPRAGHRLHSNVFFKAARGSGSNPEISRYP
jgi:hypothetical protein